MLRKMSSGTKEENITRKPKERAEEKVNRRNSSCEDRGRNRKPVEKPIKKENARVIVEKNPKESAVGRNIHKTGENECKKMKREQNGISEDIKRRKESKSEEKFTNAARTANVAEAPEKKSKKDVSTGGSEKVSRKEMDAQKKQNPGRTRMKSDRSPVESPDLDAHVEAIHERRMSLPKTILTDPMSDVEIVIGEDGRPVFLPRQASKTEEELVEGLTDISLANVKNVDERTANFIPA